MKKILVIFSSFLLISSPIMSTVGCEFILISQPKGEEPADPDPIEKQSINDVMPIGASILQNYDYTVQSMIAKIESDLGIKPETLVLNTDYLVIDKTNYLLHSGTIEFIGLPTSSWITGWLEIKVSPVSLTEIRPGQFDFRISLVDAQKINEFLINKLREILFKDSEIVNLTANDFEIISQETGTIIDVEADPQVGKYWLQAKPSSKLLGDRIEIELYNDAVFDYLRVLISEVQQAINQATIEQDVTKLTELLQQAKQVFNNPNASQDELDNSEQILKAGLDEFNNQVPSGDDVW